MSAGNCLANRHIEMIDRDIDTRQRDFGPYGSTVLTSLKTFCRQENVHLYSVRENFINKYICCVVCSC